MKEFDRLGERVAHGLGGVSDEQFENVRVAFIARAARVSRRQRKHWWLLIGATFVVVGLGGIAFWLLGTGTAAGTTASAATAEDLWLEGPKHGAPTRVELGNGAHIDLVAGARSRVHRTRDGRTLVTLEGGVIEVMVSSDDGRDWSFFAGPHLAKSQSGEFFLNYQPSAGTLEAGVTSGILRVSGGPLGVDSVSLGAGQRLTAANGRISVSSLNEANFL